MVQALSGKADFHSLSKLGDVTWKTGKIDYEFVQTA